MSHSLTISYNGIARRIKSDVFVSVPDSGNGLKVKALWDTGATDCVISESLAVSIGLPIVGDARMNHAGGFTDVKRFLADVTLPNNVTVKGVAMLGCKSVNDFDVIIGMNVITLGDFCLTNVGGKTVVSFRYPSESRIDFVKEAEDAKARMLKKLGRNAKCPCGSGMKVKDCCGKGIV